MDGDKGEPGPDKKCYACYDGVVNLFPMDCLLFQKDQRKETEADNQIRNMEAVNS